jgi:hypothetical protein
MHQSTSPAYKERPRTRAAILSARAKRKAARRPPLSMFGEVSSLADDRVVSHERSRPADFPRHSLRSRHAESYPSHYCGSFFCCALLAHGHRCRNAVTARSANSVGAFERGQAIARRRVRSLGCHAADHPDVPSTKSLRRHHFIQDCKKIGKVLSTL